MPDSVTGRILAAIDPVAASYFRLIVLAAPAGAGKTGVLREVAARMAAPLVNVNLELSSRLLELTRRQRKVQVAKLLDELVAAYGAEVVLLDNLEVLFDVTLEQEPLGLLQRLSRNRTLVASWTGTLDDGHLVYGTPDHTEYKRYKVNQDFMVVAP